MERWGSGRQPGWKAELTDQHLSDVGVEMRYSLESCPPKCMRTVRQRPRAKNTISEDSLATTSLVWLSPNAYCFAGFWLFDASVDPSP